MGLINFYNNFHKKSVAQNKLISEDNITYRLVISVLNKFATRKNMKVLDYGCGEGTLSDIVTLIDNITVRLFGESDIYVICTKR